jgi:hypothetical protein
MPTLKEKLEMAKAEGARRMGLTDAETVAVEEKPKKAAKKSTAKKPAAKKETKKSTTKKPKKNG